MKRLLTAVGLGLSVSAGIAHAVNMNSATFTMLDSTGGIVGVDATVTGTVDTLSDTWSVATTMPFFGFIWTTHDGTVFGPGTYDIDTIEGGVYTGIVVAPAQLGGHILFDWGLNTNIDVVNVWDVDCSSLSVCIYTSTDVTASNPPGPDGIRGLGMLDGPFPGFNANFDFEASAPPTATPDSKSTPAGISATFDLTGNDYATETPLAAAAVLNPDLTLSALAGITIPAGTALGGTLSDNGDGTVEYTPPAGAVGVTDSFAYTLTDADGRVSAPADVAVNITGAGNTPPVANDVSFFTDEDTVLSIDIGDTDANGVPVAEDADGDPLRFATFTQGAQGGTVTVDASGTVLSYAPAADFHGTDSFSFTVNDGSDDSNVGTVTVSVLPVNDALTCTDVNTSTPVDTALDIDVAAELLSTCTDPDGDTITLDSTTQPIQGGTLSFDGVNTLTYTPAPGFEGEDSFTYTATDGITTDTRAVSVTVGTIPFGNFTMLDAQGVTFGGTNDIIYTWDGTLNSAVDSTNFNMKLASASNWPFFGFPWTAHTIRVFGPGSYAFDTTCSVSQLETGIADCGGTPADILPLTVPVGQIGAHLLIDWNTSQNIDVIQLWEENGSFDNPPPGGLYLGPAGPIPAPDAIFRYVSRDADGDGIPGARIIDGPFVGFSPNFNLEVIQTPTLPVTIDILPHKAANIVNLRSGGQISVAILTDSEFDAAEVVPETTRFGPAQAPATRYWSRDVDRDGDDDLLLFFRIEQTGIACGDSEASLTGELRDGTPIAGSDSIVTRNCR